MSLNIFNHKPKREVSPLVALLPIGVLAFMLSLSIHLFKSDVANGSSQIALLFSSAVAAALAMFVYGTPWQRLEQAISDNIHTSSSAIIILLLIGAISGSWMLSGVVPAFIYYGMQIIHPSVFLGVACLICAMVSIVTGSSWTTIATIGVALMGIGRAQGFDDGWIAGAIISGAYFGDKVSALSDTTVLASTSARVPLFDHIRYMLITTVPSFIIALVVFFIVGAMHQAPAVGVIQRLGDLGAALLGGLLAHLGLGACTHAAGELLTDLDLVGALGLVQILTVGIDDYKLYTVDLAVDHAVDNIVARAADTYDFNINYFFCKNFGHC